MLVDLKKRYRHNKKLFVIGLTEGKKVLQSLVITQDEVTLVFFWYHRELGGGRSEGQLLVVRVKD